MKRIFAKFKRSESIESFPRSGRLCKISPRNESVNTRILLQNRFKNAAVISRQLSLSSHVKASRHTVSRKLRDSEILALMPAKKPLT